MAACDALDALSMDELQQLLQEEDKKREDVARQLRASRVQDQRQAAASLALTPAQEAALRVEFDKHDMSNSGALGIDAAKALCTGFGLTAEDAAGISEFAEDGEVSFVGLVSWLGSSSGPSGIKLALLQARLYASSIGTELQQRMAAEALKSTPQGFKSVRVCVRAGEDDFAKVPAKSSINLCAVPSDPLRFADQLARLFPDDGEVLAYERVGDETHGQVRCIACGEVHFTVAAKPGPEFNRTVKQLNKLFAECQSDRDYSDDSSDFFAFFFSFWRRFKMELVASVGEDGNAQLVLKFQTKVDTEEDGWFEPIEYFVSALPTDEPHTAARKLFEAFSFSIESDVDANDVLARESEIHPTEMLGNVRYILAARFAPMIAEVFAALLIRERLQSRNTRQNDEWAILTGLAGALESADVQLQLSTVRDAVNKLIDELAAFPTKLAERRGTMNDDVAEEGATLRQRIIEILNAARMYEHTTATGLTLLQGFVSEWGDTATVGRHSDDDTHTEEDSRTGWGLWGQLAKSVSGVAKVELHMPYLDATLDVANVPLIHYVLGPGSMTRKEVMKTMKKRKAETQNLGEDAVAALVPATQLVFDEADDDAGECFRMFLRGPDEDSAFGTSDSDSASDSKTDDSSDSD
eukprot:TRINITY_DN10812_c0_g1_i1.p1 TRINITY_DN10812_c0_g1~~TRINITY_DN10812_c0_g1_i1.p1  ORF type:complete len:668 (+),score=121.84 TRINITY_DN10812_c0_g1_i1:93-2006(+)